MKKLYEYFKKWNWSLFFAILCISIMGALGNKTIPTIHECFLVALIFGIPCGLLFAWGTKEP